MGDLIRGPWQEPSHPNLSKVSLARLEQVSTRTVERWVSAGCPHERDLAGRLTFHASSVRGWLDSQRGDAA